MTAVLASYHDLEEQTYRTVRANPFTRIHGKPPWKQKENLKAKVAKLGVQFKVSYDWLVGKGCLTLIIGAARLAADYSHAATFVEPVQPPNAPNCAGRTAEQIRILVSENDIKKRDYAVIQGFWRGCA